MLAVVSGLAVQFGHLGLNAAGAYFTARRRDALPAVAAHALWFGTAAGAALGLVILAAYAAKADLLKDIPFLYVLLTVISVPFLLLAMYFQHILLGLQRIRAYNLVEVAAKAVLLVATVLLLLVWGVGIGALVVLGAAVSAGVAAAYVWLVLASGRPRLAFDAPLFRAMIGYGLKSYTVSVLAFLVIRLDMLLVNYFLGPAQAGLYSVAVSLGDVLLIIPATVGAMLFPRISAGAPDGSTLTARVTRHTVLLMGGACGFFALVGAPAITALFGAGFAGSASPLLWLLPGIFCLGVETVLAQDLAARGYPVALLGFWGTALAANVALNVVLIPIWGISGAALASTAAYTFVFLAILVYYRRITGTPLREALIIQLADLRSLRHAFAVRPTGSG